jgi:hypothetical protein
MRPIDRRTQGSSAGAAVGEIAAAAAFALLPDPREKESARDFLPPALPVAYIFLPFFASTPTRVARRKGGREMCTNNGQSVNGDAR